MASGGHLWTLWPSVREVLRPSPRPADPPWEARIDDDAFGPLRLSGALRPTAAARQLVILVHGLGGSAQRPYMLLAAQAAERLGFAVLRLNLRGSDLTGEDIYHGGLSSDLAAVVVSPSLAVYEEIYLLGFSLGGHITLRFATEVEEPRVRAVAAVCAPLDLKRGQIHLDSAGRWLYRQHLLRGLKRIYQQVAARRPMPVPVERIARVRTLWEWDALTVVPRFGFADPEDYYARASVGPRLDALRVPSLLVAAEGDPMVPAASLRPHLAPRPPHLTVRWADRGGHVTFPADFDLDLGLGGPPGLEGQVLSWLLAQGGARR